MAPTEPTRRSWCRICSESWEVQDCGQWSAYDSDLEASGMVRSKGKCEGWAGVTEEVTVMFSCVLMLQRYLVCWERAGRISSWQTCLSWGLSEGFINLVEGCGFLEMKRAPLLASDHPHLQDLPMSLILDVNLLLMVSLQTKAVPLTIPINTAHLKFLVTVTYYHRKNCNTRKTSNKRGENIAQSFRYSVHSLHMYWVTAAW